MTTKEQGMEIYKQAENVWTIQTKDDRIVVMLYDGILEFYHPVEDIADIS